MMPRPKLRTVGGRNVTFVDYWAAGAYEVSCNCALRLRILIALVDEVGKPLLFLRDGGASFFWCHDELKMCNDRAVVREVDGWNAVIVELPYLCVAPPEDAVAEGRHSLLLARVQ